MSTRNAKSSIAQKAGIAGLLFTIIYGGFEFSHFGIPERIAIGGDTNAISVFHFPLIWLLAGIMFYGTFYAVGAMRSGKIKERPAAFVLGMAAAIFIALYWALPLVDRLAQPTTASESSLCTTRSVTATPMTGPVTIYYSDGGFCPVEITIKRGDTVKFVVAEGISARIASDYSPFNQKDAGREYSFTFTEVGTFSYYDSPSTTHRFRKFISEIFGKTHVFQGTVIVTE